MKLSDLAARIDCQLEGDGELEVGRVAGLEHAGPGDLSFFANPRYAPLLRATRATAVIMSDGPAPPCAVLRSPYPYLAFARALAIFNPPPAPPPGIHPLAAIADDARIGPDVSIGPFVSIGPGASIGARSVLHAHVTIGPGASIGDDCLLHSHVSVRERVTIGNRVVVQDGAVIGSDGFGFTRGPDGQHHKIPQVGDVIIEDDVEIGANTTIDRPSVGETRIRAGAKIDNLVQVAHAVTIGARALLAAQVGIAGSSTIEEDVVLAGQVGVAGHITIGRGARATAQTGIPNDVDPGAFVSGYPAIDNRDWLKSSAVFRRLPELRKAVSRLEERLEALEIRLSGVSRDDSR